MTMIENRNSEAGSLLEGAIGVIGRAETLFFEARKSQPDTVREIYGQMNLPAPATRQRYYNWNCTGMNYVRVESSIAIPGREVTTLFIKNREGIWDVRPKHAVEVSTIFKRDELLGTFPFLRLYAIPRYPYELHVDSAYGSIDQIVVKGRLKTKPIHCSEDIANEASYAIDRKSMRLRSLNEKTFGGRSLNLNFERLSTNETMDGKLFDLPDTPRVVVSSLKEYLDLRQRESLNSF
ncbi:MAG: hypothetical protein KGJ88_11080 [Verrucomicrobiota bacterium]|nr:hypothetical protein [Verrucomicrobiota bacterium]